MALINEEVTKLADLPLVLTLDVAGQPHRWITYAESCYYYSKEAVAWHMGSVDITVYGGTNAKTGDRSSLKMNTIIAIKGQALAKSAARSRLAAPLTNKALFRRDHNVCGYCGNHFINDKLTRDHVHPSSRGGQDVWQNVVTACGPCNKRKSAKTPEEATMQLVYIPYAPCRSEFLILMNRRILADQMNFLKKAVKNEDSRIHLL